MMHKRVPRDEKKKKEKEKEKKKQPTYSWRTSKTTVMCPISHQYGSTTLHITHMWSRSPIPSCCCTIEVTHSRWPSCFNQPLTSHRDPSGPPREPPQTSISHESSYSECTRSTISTKITSPMSAQLNMNGFNRKWGPTMGLPWSTPSSPSLEVIINKQLARP